MMNETLEEIWHEFAEKLGHFIRSRVGDPATAEDIRQDVFVKIQRRLGQLQDQTRLEAWIFQIARNAIIDHYRKRRQTVAMPREIPVEPAGDNAEIEGLKASFRRMIHALPEPYRDAIVLTELEGMTQHELADRQGISLSGAKSRVQRGRAQLKKMLHECCAFEFDARGRVIDCSPHAKVACEECGTGGSSPSP